MTDDITPLLLLDLEIPIPLEKEFTVPCCIRGYHIYRWKQWKAEIGSILTSEPEVRPGALVEDKYSIAVLDNGQTIGHVPKFLSQLIFFFLKYEGTLSIKVTGERRFSFDLPQGGMEIPADFVFKTVDAKLHNQMREKVLKELENFEGRRKVGIDKSLKKKEKKNKKYQKVCFQFFNP